VGEFIRDAEARGKSHRRARLRKKKSYEEGIDVVTTRPRRSDNTAWNTFPFWQGFSQLRLSLSTQHSLSGSLNMDLEPITHARIELVADHPYHSIITRPHISIAVYDFLRS
jgi:hypothetical protein